MKPHKTYGWWLLISIVLALLLAIGLIWWYIDIHNANQSLNIWLDGNAVQKGLQ